MSDLKPPYWLVRRLEGAKQRCTNPKSPGYVNYGGRGLVFGFDKAKDAAKSLWDGYGPFGREMSVDRIDNDLGYVPGNLRVGTRRANQSNRRNTILSEYHEDHWPFAYSAVVRLQSAGYTRAQIIEHAEERVKNRKPYYRVTAKRLSGMIGSLPAGVMILPYRHEAVSKMTPPALDQDRVRSPR